MTTEQRTKMDARNNELIAYYDGGKKTAAMCGRKFKISRQRVQQILRKAGAWRPHERSERTSFLGVTVKEATKARLGEMATDDASVSKIVSDVLDQHVERRSR